MHFDALGTAPYVCFPTCCLISDALLASAFPNWDPNHIRPHTWASIETENSTGDPDVQLGLRSPGLSSTG